MSTWERELRRRAQSERERLHMPEEMSARLDEVLAGLPEGAHQPSGGRAIWLRAARTAAAVALAVLVILPNVSRQAAYAMQEIPLLGALVRVVTVREYHLEGADQRLDLAVPQVTPEEPELFSAAEEINQDVDAIVSNLLDEMGETVAEDYATSTPEELAEDLQARAEQATKTTIEMDYEMVTDTERWFTLRLTLYTLGGSGSVQFRYYHIDKEAGSLVTLGGLLTPESLETVSEEIMRQMREQMASEEDVVYWLDSDVPEWDFTGISEDQSFYWNEDGDLVIVFDEYAVAPGYMGCPEFTIPETAYTLRSGQ